MKKILLICYFIWAPLSMAVVYQTYDKHGNVEYTDMFKQGAKAHALPKPILESMNHSLVSDKSLHVGNTPAAQKLKLANLINQEIEALKVQLVNIPMNDYEEALIKIKISKLQVKRDALFTDAESDNKVYEIKEKIAALEAALKSARLAHQSTRVIEARLALEKSKLGM